MTKQIEVGVEKLQLASRNFAEAQTEQEMRSVLAEFRSAMDWLEDSEHFEEAHQALDAAGRKVNAQYGCKLHYDGDSGYSQTCPVKLAHTRVGISADIIETSVRCSICDLDPAKCDHVRGREYDGETCLRITVEGRIVGGPIVRRPAFPDARMHGVPISIEILRETLGDGFVPGTPLRCDACALDCEGVIELPPGQGVGHGPLEL